MSFEDIELPEEMDLPEEEINEDNETETAEDAAPSGRFDKLFGEGSKKFKLSTLMVS